MHADSEIKMARHYIEHMDEVEGWFSKESAALITAVHLFQRSLSLPGDILEIGVWRGKSGILLCQLIDPDDEQCVLSDRFDGGDFPYVYGEDYLAALEDNLSRWVEYSDSVVIEECDSTHLPPRVVHMSGSIRICHVDGSHQYERAMEDMLICADLLMPRGCMIVDDAFNICLLGVNQALNEFLRTSPFTAFAVGFDKVFLCHEDCYDEYFGMWTSQEIVSFMDDYDIGQNQFLKRPAFFYGREVATLVNRTILPDATPGQSS